MLKNILVGLDDSGWSRTALQHALDLAVAQGGRLHLATVSEDLALDTDRDIPPGPLGPDLALPAEADLPDSYDHPETPPLLAEARTACEQRGVTAVTSRLVGDPADRLLRHLVAADLLVVGRGGMEAGSLPGLGRCARRVVRRAPKAVLITAAEYVAAGALLCYYDGSVAGQRTLQLAAQLCLVGEHELQVLCTGRGREDRRHRDDAAAYLRAYRFGHEVASLTEEPCDGLHRLANLTDATAVLVPRSVALPLLPTLAERVIETVKLPVFVQS